MPFPLSFSGTVTRLPYAVSAIGIFFSQHLLSWVLARPYQTASDPGWEFWLLPLRAMVKNENPLNAVMMLGFAALLLAGWALVALSFRRAADAKVSAGLAPFAMVPVIQIPVVLVLSLIPSRPATLQPPAETVEVSDWAAAAQGIAAGVAVTLAGVALSTHGFGTYGFGLFVLVPVIVGGVTGYLLNRTRDRGAGTTMLLAASATALGGVALLAAALEGVICIVLMAPLGLGLALPGSLLGRSIAVRLNQSPGELLSSALVLPLVFALEALVPLTTNFETRNEIDVAASPARVWQVIVRMEPIEAPPALPYRLGVAYPISGEVLGEGVGATRLGVFSTGTAVERVTEWEANRKLAFVVTKDVPALTELSPYPHLHTPHQIGYFRTTLTSFELVPVSDGRTRIIERTAHELKLEPALYWLPLARHIVGQNNARVLAHIKRQAERRAVTGN